MNDQVPMTNRDREGASSRLIRQEARRSLRNWSLDIASLGIHWSLDNWSLVISIGHWSFLMPTSKVQLVIDDFGNDASAVTRLIGLEPSAVGVAEATPPGSLNPGASWIFDIAMPQTESLEGQALALLRFLEAHAEAIRQAAACYPASIAIGIQDGGQVEQAEIDLVPLIIADVSKLGLGLHIHFSSAAVKGRKKK